MSDRVPVVFIDDDQHIRIANTQTLDLAGFEVTGLERAERGLPLLSWDWAGVVVCDIRMEGMDGLTFLQKVREIDPDLPVILITGHGDISMAVQSIRDGAYDFIEKPFARGRQTQINPGKSQFASGTGGTKRARTAHHWQYPCHASLACHHRTNCRYGCGYIDPG